MNVEECRQFIGGHLEDIADALPKHYKLTLVARHTGGLDADIVLTDDDLTKAANAITALGARTQGQEGKLVIAKEIL